MRISSNISHNWAIIIDGKNLLKLDEIIKKHFNIKETTIKYFARYSDRTYIETDNIEEIIKNDNIKDSKIECVSISANNKEFTKKLDISFCSIKRINYSIYGNSQEWNNQIFFDIEKYLKNLKEWYSLLSFSKFSQILNIVSAMIIGFLLAKKDYTTENNILIVILAFSVIATVNEVIKRGISYLFPSVIFRIGDGINRHEDLIKLRENILWVVIISSIIGILVTLATKNL